MQAIRGGGTPPLHLRVIPEETKACPRRKTAWKGAIRTLGGCSSPYERPCHTREGRGLYGRMAQPCNPSATPPALHGRQPVSTATLVEEMRRRGVRLEADGLTLRVDAPEEAATDELRDTLREHKRALIRHLERERQRLEAANRRGLVIKWAREPGYVALHDPTTGEWHEVAASDCPPWILKDAKAHRRRGRIEA